MKYQGSRAAVDLLGDLMAARLGEYLPEQPRATLIPVPLHPTRMRERGFNQAERLARRVGRRTGIPVRVDLLARRRFTASLTTLDAGERRAAVADAFRLSRPPPVSGLLILVDDVWTTGATALACVDALRAGAEGVPVWVLTAAITPSPSG